MKLVLAQMIHETNTFSPIPTGLDQFSRGFGLPREGDEAIKAYRNTGTALGAFIDLAERAGMSYALPVAATASPGRQADDSTFEYIASRIVAAVSEGCDAVLLDLHGAMVTASYDDAEGELLRRLRLVAPNVPIGVALDMHCNLSSAMCDLATVVAGYQTYPHIDRYETGMRAGQPILALLRGEAAPVLRYGFRPMLPHVMRQSSFDTPNSEIQARAKEMEGQGALSATVFVGFPHADIPDAGLSAVVVTDNDTELAAKFSEELLDMAWNSREQWVYKIEPLEDSIRRAVALPPGDGPVVLLDHYDNCSSGGTMDTTKVLGAILDAGLEDVLVFGICDPAAVKAMERAGVGSEITLDLGGKIDMPSMGLVATPRTVSGTVTNIVDGTFRREGPNSPGALVNMGRSAVLDSGSVQIVVVSERTEPSDIACFKVLGLDPSAKRYVMLKSRVHWRASLGDMARVVVECAGEGVCTSDYSQLNFTRLGREVYPLVDKDYGEYK